MLYLDNPEGSKKHAVPGVSGRDYAVEHVYPAPDSLKQVFWKAHSHKIPGLILREMRGRYIYHLMHFIFTLPYREPSKCITVKLYIYSLPGRYLPELLKHAPLDYAEKGLPILIHTGDSPESTAFGP